MIESDIQILKGAYRKWLTELGLEFSKKDKLSDLEERLIHTGIKLDEDEVLKLSRPLQDFINSARATPEETVPTPIRNKIIKRSYYMTDKFGLQVGSKRSYITSLLSNGDWWTRPQLLRKAKKELGACSIYTLDCVETYLRKNNYDLRTSTNDEGITTLKLYV